MEKLVELWQTVLDELEIDHGPSTIATWFARTKVQNLSGKTLTILCPDYYTHDFIKRRYLNQIQRILTAKVKKELQLNFVIDQDVSNQVSGPLFDQIPKNIPPSKEGAPAQETSPEVRTISNQSIGLNPNYTFDNFVVGSNNRVAHAAALAVSESPGQIYNPLLIYGGTGVGKTHLMHAIGNELIKRFPDLKLLCFASEKFTNDLIEAIRLKKATHEFRRLYRTTDAILMDDIQFLAGKSGSQEEFFHTFNTLYSQQKQIIVCSDRPPKETANLADRLVSRLNGGLLVDITPPDYETRVAIIKTKAAGLQLALSEECINLVAETIEENIRVIEGTLLKIKNAVLGQNLAPTLGLIKSILSDTRPQKISTRLTPELVLNLVTQYFDTSIRDLCGKRRKQEIVTPRQVTMYLLRNEIGMNFTDIGQILGGRDHTTIIHGCDRIQDKLNEKDKYLRSIIRNLREQLYS